MSTYGQQFGFAAESTWGTIVTPDHFLALQGSESVRYDQVLAASQALKSGQFGPPVSRARKISYTAGGDIPLGLTFSKLGLLLKTGMGSSGTATLVSGSVYKQVHQIGSTDGKSLTLQMGRNEVSTGTIKPFTYPGAKVTQIAIAASDGDTDAAQFTVSVDAKDEQTGTALAAASYASGASAGAFTFADINTIKLGGTASTAAGVISVTSGVQATSLLHGFSLNIAVPTATDRRGLGNQGAKSEQVNNGIPMVTGSFNGEFTLQSEIYDVWKAGTAVPLQITFTGPVISGGNNYLFDIILPAVKFTTASPQIDGFNVTPQTIDFTAYLDDTNGNNMCQITYQNTDSAI